MPRLVYLAALTLAITPATPAQASSPSMAKLAAHTKISKSKATAKRFDFRLVWTHWLNETHKPAKGTRY